ncbi:hypothetical protein L226DRAFT_614709 [Lentinus tigrinus ALCF2SS1-7]|uniref:Uncharacterized protein n=1 Tax=Lentinus tigrinus ALCF2SS1-6 TaxID=1328759 RepID=A0A5C2RWZ2_9APHY|nr:hypothetical protein L227DRAFT_656773 [Lentinus tigrinus ALCF2SS1-6]RPD72507.1 hypothetical protein L226DRAFT_614709 [Lentinus tigrinus ALCF2SS1-7]
MGQPSAPLLTRRQVHLPGVPDSSTRAHYPMQPEPENAAASSRISGIIPPSPSTTASSPTTQLSFSPLSNMTTCKQVKIQWNYAGRSTDLVLLIVASTALHDPSPSTSKRDNVVALPIAFGLNSTMGAWTWPTVNVTSGWYTLEAVGPGIAAMSPEFHVANGTDTSCLAGSNSPLAFNAGTTSLPHPSTSTSASPSPSTSASVSSTTSGKGPCTDCSASGDSGMVLGVTLGGVVALAAAVFAAYRFLLPHCIRRRRARRSSAQDSDDEHKDLNRSISQATSPGTMSDEKRSALHSLKASARPLPPLPPSDPPTFIPPFKSDTFIPIVISEPETRKRAAKPIVLAKLDTDLSQTVTPSSYSGPPTRGSLYATDRSDAASSVWARRFSTASTWSGGASRSSPVPSSATSVMYRVRDSALSAWALVRPSSGGDPGSDTSRNRSSSIHRKAASVDGLKMARSSAPVPDVPPLPARFRTEGRQSVG